MAGLSMEHNLLRSNGSTRLKGPGAGQRGKLKRKCSEIEVFDDYAAVDLGHGVVSKISICDVSCVTGVAWHWDADGYAKNSKLGRLQNVILQPPQGLVVDHINGDRLDNRRFNLRLATRSLNSRNVNFGKIVGRSGVRGVSWNSNQRKWVVRPRVNGLKLFLGYYNTLEAAANRYHEFVKTLK